MALTKVSNNALSNISVLPSAIETGALTLLSTQTASSSASIEFTSGIDSTYSSYVFKFIDIHAVSGGANNEFQFNLSTDGGSNYNVTKTTTSFDAIHKEDGTDSGVGYNTGNDLAQSTAFQRLHVYRINDAIADESFSGEMHLFNPSSDTFVKHFIARCNGIVQNDGSQETPIAGYGNTTNAINAIIFRMSSGNIDDGIIKMYGVK